HFGRETSMTAVRAERAALPQKPSLPITIALQELCSAVRLKLFAEAVLSSPDGGENPGSEICMAAMSRPALCRSLACASSNVWRASRDTSLRKYITIKDRVVAM